MGSRENFSIFISNLGGNYAVELQNGEIREFFLQSSSNFLEKFFASGGINCNYSFPSISAPAEVARGSHGSRADENPDRPGRTQHLS
jgi:hypothetical protein